GRGAGEIVPPRGCSLAARLQASLYFLDWHVAVLAVADDRVVQPAKAPAHVDACRCKSALEKLAGGALLGQHVVLVAGRVPLVEGVDCVGAVWLAPEMREAHIVAGRAHVGPSVKSGLVRVTGAVNQPVEKIAARPGGIERFRAHPGVGVNLRAWTTTPV